MTREVKGMELPCPYCGVLLDERYVGQPMVCIVTGEGFILQRPTRVVNLSHDKCEVYVGRPTQFGNPFSVRRHNAFDRTDAIAKHEQWLKSQPVLVAEVRRLLKGKVIGCWCKPKPCHADTLARVAEMTEQELAEWRCVTTPPVLYLALFEPEE